MTSMKIGVVSLCLAIALLCGACEEAVQQQVEARVETPAISNRIQLAAAVVANLGVRFETVTTERPGTWIGVPGKLLVPRESRHRLISAAKGRLYWKKERLSRVDKGEVLAIIESPALSAVQQELSAASQNLKLAREQKGGGAAAVLRHDQAERRYRQQLGTLAVLTGIASSRLEKRTDGRPFWQTLMQLELRSPSAGYFFEIFAADGELLKEGTHLGSVLDISDLVFRGLVAPDLFRQIPQNARVRVPLSNGEIVETRLHGPLPIGDAETVKVWLEAPVENKALRLVDGTPVVGQIQIKESEFEEAILPERCIVFEDLQALVFKRDAARPDFVIRTPVEIGNGSGGMYEILSGVLEGDEVACEGIHQIKRMGSGSAPEGGHFHADGTWHEGKE